MNFLEINAEWYDGLKELHRAYKAEIGEEPPTEDNFQSLKKAVENGQIRFYGCVCDQKLAACCSVSFTFSTFHYGKSGVFEDFYIHPAYRHGGIARKLAAYAYEQSQVGSLSVGCADCDVEMYKSIGFGVSLGNLLAFEPQRTCAVPGDAS